LCTYVQVFLSTLRIFLEGQIFTKNYHFGRFLVPYGHIFKATTVKFGMRCGLGAPSPRQNFVKKKSLKGIYLFGENLYQKLPFLAIFWAVSPHLLSQNGNIWREGANLGDPSHAKFSKNRLRGIPILGKLYQN